MDLQLMLTGHKQKQARKPKRESGMYKASSRTSRNERILALILISQQATRSEKRPKETFQRRRAIDNQDGVG